MQRKWQDLAPPDDPGSWYDVDGVWPTNRGSYETADFNTSTDYAASAAGSVSYAFSAGVTDTSAVNREYVVTSTKIWQYDPTAGSVMTDRTGGVGVGGRGMMAQFGNATIAVMGSPLGALPGVATSYSTGGNFAALAGAPQGNTVLIAFNAAWIFNTDTGSDCFEMSDVGDYTNWATGEWFAGQVFDGVGPINAAVEFGGPVYSFKMDSIHRHRYVGGTVKVATDQVWSGLGCGSRNAACAGATGILFQGYAKSDTGSPPVPFYWYDGVNPPVLTNPFTTIGSSSTASRISYDVFRDIFTVWDGTALYYFSPRLMAWGRGTVQMGSSPGSLKPVLSLGMYGLRSPSPTTPSWVTPSADVLRRFSVATPGTGTSYVETTKFGTANQKLNFSRVIPRVRRLVDVGTQSEAVTASCFRELHDTSASSTPTYTKSANRYRWDGMASDNFMRFKYSATDYDVEIDDLEPEAKPAGKN